MTPFDVFPAMLCAVFFVIVPLSCLALSRLGWSRLAARYRRGSNESPTSAVSFQTIRFGTFGPHYTKCVTIGVSREGLFLSVFFPFSLGHSPLLVPWTDVRSSGRSNFAFSAYDRYRVGSETVATPSSGGGARLLRDRVGKRAS